MTNDLSETKEARYDRAIRLRDEGKIAEALAAVEQLVADFPDYGLARLAQAVFYEKTGQAELAMQAAAQACRLEPDNPFYYTAVSSLAIRSGRRQEAEEALMKAQEARFAAQLKKMQEENDNDPDATTP